MGCVNIKPKTPGNSQFLKPKSRLPSIDCRKKSSIVPDTILQNVQIISDTINDEKMAKFAKQALKNHNLFDGLANEQIQAIIKVMQIGVSKKGQNIFQEGNKASCFFIIVQGQVQVLINKQRIRKLGPGQSFGELALIYFHNRSATIRNISENSIFLCLKANYFQIIMSEQRRKNIQVSRQLVSKVQIFDLLSIKEKYKLANSLIKQAHLKGQILFKQGEIPYSFYIIYQGKVQITIQSSNPTICKLGRLQCFGESVFKPNARREGTAVVTQNLVCFTINQYLMRECIGQTIQDIIFHNIKKWALNQSKLFKNLDNNQIDFISFRVKQNTAEQSEIILQKGKKVQSLFICIQGRINDRDIGSIFNCQQWLKWKQQPQIDLYADKNITKNDNGAYAEIKFIDLQQILNDLKLKKRTKRISFSQQIVQKQKFSKIKLEIENLYYLKKLGEGQFGSVHLVKDKITQSQYAVKVLQKKIIKQEQMLKYVVAEREILETICHPLIVGFYKAYEDNNNIYFFMEYIDGIQMFQAIRQIGILNKSITRYYFGSILLAIQNLHQLNIIYRDIKPQNSMVTHSGKVMLIDLGTCKKLDTSTAFRTSTIIGTPHYMAPQVISGKGYSFQADYWSLGILLYELVCGKLPFAEFNEKPYQIYSQVLKSKITFPKYVTDKALKEIILMLLEKNANKRAIKNIFQKIKNSSYFIGFKWQDLDSDKMKSPYIPRKYRNKNNQQKKHGEIPLINIVNKMNKQLSFQNKQVSYFSQWKINMII